MKKLIVILVLTVAGCASSTALVSSVSVKNGWDIQIINTIPLK